MTQHAYAQALRAIDPMRRYGSVQKVMPGRIEASGPYCTVGDICDIALGVSHTGNASASAEVVAVNDDHIVLVPLHIATSIYPGASVQLLSSRADAAVGDCFAGRAIDPMGDPIDDGGRIFSQATLPLQGVAPAPLDRYEPETVFATGIRAIDGLLTIGFGQRLGIFSASGVGKTSLIVQLARQAPSQRCIFCLVGERGREVENIWTQLSQSDDAARYTIVAATSDLSAPLRVRALHQALCLAEFWRDAGEQVLLIVDSVTRYAMAQREIGLAAGAPPTLRAYTPNVFSALPRVVERCGAVKTGGSITALFTVLAETDDVDDPIAEVMKSLLDGHIVLSRTLAEQGRFPAIDILRSVSRQSERLMERAHAEAARHTLSLLSHYEEARILIESGIYKAGANARVDESVRQRENILAFLRQPLDEHAGLADSIARVRQFAARGGRHA